MGVTNQPVKRSPPDGGAAALTVCGSPAGSVAAEAAGTDAAASAPPAANVPRVKSWAQSRVYLNFGDLSVVWQHRSWGQPVDPKYLWGATFYGEKGTLKAGVSSYDFIPLGQGQAIHEDVAYELEEYPEDKTEKDLEKHVAPAIRVHMKDLLTAIARRGRPVADIEQGHISSASCILANLSMRLGRTLVWNADKGEVVGDPEANALLRRPYRAPWIHPDPTTV